MGCARQRLRKDASGARGTGTDENGRERKRKDITNHRAAGRLLVDGGPVRGTVFVVCKVEGDDWMSHCFDPMLVRASCEQLYSAL